MHPKWQDGRYVFGKTMYFTFSRERLDEKPGPIAEIFTRVLAAINAELALLRTDHSKRGTLVEIRTDETTTEEIPTNDEETEWERVELAYNIVASEEVIGKEPPPEWWGSFTGRSEHFITSIDAFPWLPGGSSNRLFEQGSNPLF